MNELVSADPPIFDYPIYERIKADATLDQLWTLFKWIMQGNKYTVTGISTDHISLSYAGMYVAVLPDGSTHT